MTATAPTATTAAAADEARRAELAAFLRSRRERISPEQAGLPRTARRRTPGLRREEVAHLAAVGVTWYTWLEQGRAINVSPGVLDAVARALQMDPTERSHAFALAGVSDPRAETACTTITAATLRTMHKLAPFPATVKNARYDILAWNQPYADVFGDPAELAPEHRNGLWLMAMSERWRTQCVERDVMLPAIVAKFRQAMTEHLAEPAWKERLDMLLAASEEFRALWELHDVAPMTPHVKRYLHPDPEIGMLRLEHRHLWLSPDRSAKRLVACVPVDDESEERLERLAARTGAARTGAARTGTLAG
ncbi:helix-turn-helix transcriptional regulator [Streptomyces beihaiensis]|uniref:Helix-turn-helix transcriptional regulator n=1 Tax=Streptomyces beihaiensis TaxID=2984495 RepID=A0ABT3TNM1_9ACTN|nr:helix-turn-helix transcriptional regulator [Streptomyces beihaiensis]MCX3058638.1 helix-turn-helix transcriptional regulator [Streptomyces beihaiensis]